MADKYIVFNYEEWRSSGDAEPIPDAVVIRRQDVFAPPALHMYAHSISIGVRTMQLSDGEMAANKAKQLQGIADYFHEQAVLAEEEAWKLPD